MGGDKIERYLRELITDMGWRWQQGLQMWWCDAVIQEKDLHGKKMVVPILTRAIMGTDITACTTGHWMILLEPGHSRICLHQSGTLQCMFFEPGSPFRGGFWVIYFPEPRSHACTLAAREAGKIEYQDYLCFPPKLLRSKKRLFRGAGQPWRITNVL